MKKISIIFGSTTGNTERVAEIIKDNMAECEVTVTDVCNAKDEMIKSADTVLFGASTWGYGEIQDDFLEYYNSMKSELLSAKDVAVFGCGDSVGFSDVYCRAVDLIIEKASECGANVIGEGLKVDGDVDDNVSKIEAFAKELV
ncbi:flavodoxin [Alkaliphilus metalliredigens QYMF]|uniref:Flavodoxin n=1 Tax=Alkaliphilus metalliredigens (strain QYMF) TaxID=293826 RepID=A6TSI6_ALKMQ|nr:flavodoxin [Alkaliphilus metalliredigens]ABR49154.1 flavodoxin [Alkaliphilus metalliredigens QYMF]